MVIRKIKIIISFFDITSLYAVVGDAVAIIVFFRVIWLALVSDCIFLANAYLSFLHNFFPWKSKHLLSCADEQKMRLLPS